MKIILFSHFIFVLHFSYAQTSMENINKMLDNWHHAAAIADENLFFGSMTNDAHYIGTDESEDWTRDEMKVWAKDIFERESAWVFIKNNRHIYLHENENIAWFDETLDTWMGVCRGSGVVELTKDGWKIKHYVLSIAVPNDKVDAYLKLLSK